MVTEAERGAMFQIHATLERVERAPLLSRIGKARDLGPDVFVHASLNEAVAEVLDQMLDPWPKSPLDKMVAEAYEDALRRIHRTAPLVSRVIRTLDPRWRTYWKYEKELLLILDRSSDTWIPLDRGDRGIVRDHIQEVFETAGLAALSGVMDDHPHLQKVMAALLEGYLITGIDIDGERMRLRGF